MSTAVEIDKAIIDKCALDNSDLSLKFIKDILIAKNTDRSLAAPFEFKDKKAEA